jgi:glycosyltransferase involved in cell wall biosynthesis
MEKTPFAKLSVFFPMWNEQDYIERAIDAAREECEDLLAQGDIADYEMIVIDDASTDATPEIAAALAAQDPRVRVVRHEENRKLGGSMKSGFQAATGDLVLYRCRFAIRHARCSQGNSTTSLLRRRCCQRLSI